MEGKYKMQVTVRLESNSYPRMQQIANRIYNMKIQQEESDPDYVSVSTSKQDIKDETTNTGQDKV